MSLVNKLLSWNPAAAAAKSLSRVQLYVTP